MTTLLSFRDLTDEMLALDALAAMDEGEWTEEHELLSVELAAKLAAKTDNFWEYRLSCKAQAKAAKEYADTIINKANRLTNRVEWLDRYMLAEIERGGRGFVKGEHWEVRAQRNSAGSVELSVLPTALPAEFQRRIPEVIEADKVAITNAIKSGQTVPGCTLTFGKHLRAK